MGSSREKKEFMGQFQHLKIQLEDIKSATNNFADNKVIGSGGFGKVYKGEISHSKGRCMAAFKRLNSIYGQGNREFLNEIMVLSRYTHENLVSLLGYCDEGGENILVYEYVSQGSLDRHLSVPSLTWSQRLKICLAAARGLNYLNDPKKTHQRIVHGDIKSSNILLGQNWNAKVSDLGLSKVGPANQDVTIIFSDGAGTPGYCDPMCIEMGLLTKESDIYSFGVVLFEVICGRLCFEASNHQLKILVPFWKRSYKGKKLDEIISQHLLQQIDLISVGIFSDIAYLCLKRSREKRPTIAHVVEELEIALEFQQFFERVKQLKAEERITTAAAAPPHIDRSEEELNMLLSKGILVNRGKTWFSLNKYGEHCEMISAAEFLIPTTSVDDNGSEEDSRLAELISCREDSRFAGGSFLTYSGKVKAHAKAQFLSPGIMYRVILVFKMVDKNLKLQPYPIKCKLEGETKYSYKFNSRERENGWNRAEVYRFTSDTTHFDLKFEIGDNGPAADSLILEGIEFRPL